MVESKEDVKLIIIGNGFDIAHSLPTRYEDFKKYLRESISDNNLDEGRRLAELGEVPAPTIPNIHTANGCKADYKQEKNCVLFNRGDGKEKAGYINGNFICMYFIWAFVSREAHELYNSRSKRHA